jgi:hypothetical protein
MTAKFTSLMIAIVVMVPVAGAILNQAAQMVA